MKIELIKLRFNQTFSYKYKSFTYCCNALKNNPCILFTDEDVMSDPSYSISDQDNSLPRFCMTRTLSFRDWEDEWEKLKISPSGSALIAGKKYKFMYQKNKIYQENIRNCQKKEQNSGSGAKKLIVRKKKRNYKTRYMNWIERSISIGNLAISRI